MPKSRAPKLLPDEIRLMEMKRHPTILEVIGVVDGDPVMNLPIKDKLLQFGYGDFEPYYWDILADDSSDYSVSAAVASMCVLKSPEAKNRTLVFVRDFSDLSEVTREAAATALFLHEIGHVDDFERGINLRVDEPVDIPKAEEYAHRYACRIMVEEGLIVSLLAYIKALLPLYLSSEVEGIRLSAERFRDSDQFRSYTRLLERCQEL